MTNELLTISAVAERLSLSTRTIRAHIAAGLLPAVKLGGLTRIRPEDLERFFRNLPPAKPAARKQRGAGGAR